MSSPNGGRWIFSPATGSGFSGVTLGINNGIAPVFPKPVTGALNIEVFTNPTVSAVPPPESGFQASTTDPNGTLDSGFLTGRDIHLASGDFLAVDHGNDSVAGSATTTGSIGPARMTLGTGNQTVVGAKFDTLVGGSGTQILSALIGNETVIGGNSTESIWGGANDSIEASAGFGSQIVVNAGGTTIVAGISGSATIGAASQNTITALAGNQNVGIGAGTNDFIDLTNNTGLDFVLGAVGDTITGNGGTTNVEGSAGGMSIKVGAAGTTNISGGTNSVAGNTISGGSGNLDFNPSAAAGKGDLINLSGSSGTATINAFSFGATRVAAHDTILAGNSADSVFGGDGDRIGTGAGSVVGGTHQWTHADTATGAVVGFGSNDGVSSTIYDTVSGTASRGNTPGTSTAQVTVGSFNTQTDFLFYQNETAATNSAIVATSQATTVGGAASTIVTLPDGTVMTLVGVSQAQLSSALAAGTLFKP